MPSGLPFFKHSHDAPLLHSNRESDMAAMAALIEFSPAALICLDNHGRVTLWNPAAARLFGRSAQEALGKPCPIVLPKGGSGRQGGGEASLPGKNGKPLEISAISAPLLDADKKEVGAILVANDVTERRSLENQLYHAQKMEAMGQLTGGVAHDFNNLLGVAIGNLDLMEGEVTEKGEELRAAALSAMLRGSELVKALLAFSRRQPLQPSLVDVNSHLNHAIGLMRRTLGEAIEINLKVQEPLWPAHIDATQLESAIANLAINARDAMPAGGRLLITARNVTLDDDYVKQNPESALGNYVCIEVGDTGSGMPPEVLAQAFEPFFTTKEKGKGTGLGLSMVYGFIKQSGGHIKIYSEVGIGTNVRLYLPRAQGEQTAAAPPADHAALPAGKGESILVVEDNAELRRMAITQLEGLGYKILEAANGSEALAIIDGGQKIDALFSDVIMPGGLSGFDVARKARVRYPELPILLTSGFPGTLAAEGQEIAPGFAVELLGKPYRKHELAQKIRDTLDRNTSAQGD